MALQLCEVVKLFVHLKSLTLTQPANHNYFKEFATKDCQPEWEQLVALKSLKSLKTEWDKNCSLMRQEDAYPQEQPTTHMSCNLARRHAAAVRLSRPCYGVTCEAYIVCRVT